MNYCRDDYRPTIATANSRDRRINLSVV
jgi:hypothetical protein